MLSQAYIDNLWKVGQETEVKCGLDIFKLLEPPAKFGLNGGFVYTEQMSETWKTIKNFDMYEVSSHGNIRNQTTNKLLTQHLRNGYYSVSLRKNGKSCTKNVHRLVAETFLQEPEAKKMQVNHKDLNKHNNNINNLEFVTEKENTAHAIANGATKVHSRRIAQYEGEKKIQEFESIIAASKATGISDKHIGSVCRGNRITTGGFKWKYIDEDFTPVERSAVEGVEVADYPNYIVTSDGRIYSKRRRDYLKPRTLPSGYLTVKLCNNKISKDFYVHVLQRQAQEVKAN